jgi:hypothetical protein
MGSLQDKMVKLKILFEPQLNAHKCVHCFEEVPNFRPEDAVYEIISKVKSPRGHPPGRGTETNFVVLS